MIVCAVTVRPHPVLVAVRTLALLLALLAAQPATATQIVVTTNADELNIDGDCSLRRRSAPPISTARAMPVPPARRPTGTTSSSRATPSTP